LNSDVEVTEGWLDPLVEMMNSNPLIAACMPKIKSYDMPDFFEYAGASGGFIDKNGYPFCQGRIFDSIETDYGQYDIAREIFWASGACLMIRAKLYTLAGGLDSHFFAHFEEIDLCWRLKNRGYKIMVVPSSVVFHVGGGTLPKTNSRKTYLNFRNNLLMLYKNLPENKLFVTLLRRLFLDMISGFRLLLQFKASEFSAIIRAHFSFYSEMSSFRRFRNEELKFISRREHKEIYHGNIVIDYFFRKKITFKSLEWNLQEMNRNKK
jgi:GT2 family glycosyltransferase